MRAAARGSSASNATRPGLFENPSARRAQASYHGSHGRKRLRRTVRRPRRPAAPARRVRRADAGRAAPRVGRQRDQARRRPHDGGDQPRQHPGHDGAAYRAAALGDGDRLSRSGHARARGARGPAVAPSALRMGRGRSWSMLAFLLGAIALSVGLAACGGAAKKAKATSTAPRHTRTAAAGTATTGGAASRTTTTSTPSAAGASTAAGSTTTRSGGAGAAGSAGSSGGAGLAGATATTTSACQGQDCQNGSPTVPGSVPPVNGKCGPGYVYVAAQDGGPALCIPRATVTTTTTPATQ